MILPASKLEQREGRLPVEAQAGVAKVTITISGNPTPVCREALEAVARQVLQANGIRHGRLGFGLGGGLS